MLFLKDPFTDAVQGPISQQKLRELAQSGEIDGAWEVARSNSGPWTKAEKIKGLEFKSAESDDVEELLPAETDEDDWVPKSPSSNTRQTVASRFHNAARSRNLDHAVKADDSLFRIVLKLTYGSKEYSFHDNDFPVLSACLRIGALFLRIWFVFGLFGLSVSGITLAVDPNPTSLLAFCQLTGDDLTLYVTNGEIKASFAAPFWGIVRHCFYFLGIMGLFEFIRVIMEIEKNTRHRASA